LSQPYENTPGVFNIKLSMAVIGAEWRREGAVSAILNPEYFDAVMRSALYAPDMNSAITEDSGRRILFVPADPAAMRSTSAAPDPFFVRHQRSRRTETVLDGPPAMANSGWWSSAPCRCAGWDWTRRWWSAWGAIRP
jgi:hypothetical protein